MFLYFFVCIFLFSCSKNINEVTNENNTNTLTKNEEKAVDNTLNINNQKKEKVFKYGKTSKVIISVNKSIITNLDIDARCKMVAYLSRREQKDFLQGIRPQVKQRLIDEAIYEQLAERFKMEISNEIIANYCKDYGKRFNITGEALAQKLKKEGLYETFIKMVRSRVIASYITMGALQKELIRINEKEIDFEIKQAQKSNEQKQYLLSEIVFCSGRGIQGTSAKSMAQKTYDELVKMKEKMSVLVAFQLIAQQLSQSASALNGGFLGWVSIDKIDEVTADTVKNMIIGSFSTPILMKNGNYRIICLNDVKEPGLVPYSESKIKLAVVSVPFNKSMSREEIAQIERRISAILDCKSEKELQGVAKDFGYKFEIQKANMQRIPEKIKETKIGTCAQPILLKNSLNIYMPLSKEQEKINFSIKREEVKESLEQSKKIAYAEKIFKDFKNRALIIRNSAENN
ncbi:MAG: peptidylprolyl isomerase [Holosporales bacterium]|nr:peptidylprolyl isomerase [Holosporales bacterium]